MLPIAVMLAVQGVGTPVCAPATVQATIKTAIAQLQRQELAAAKATVAPIADCPVVDAATHLAHVMAADLASRERDWRRVRQLIATAGFHPETKSGGLAQFLAMRADQGLDDAAAFTTDRDLTLAANDARLAAAGEKIETFRVPAGAVSAYHTTVMQGGFRRLYEFVARPDDKAAYPVTVMLTEDSGAGQMMQQLGLGKGAPGGAPLFLDLYTCTGHQTLAPVAGKGGAAPDYAAVKARVAEALSQPGALAATPPPDTGVCQGIGWLLPGFDVKPR